MPISRLLAMRSSLVRVKISILKKKIVSAILSILVIASYSSLCTVSVSAETVTTVVMTYADMTFSKELYGIETDKIKEGQNTQGLNDIGGLCDNLSFRTNGSVTVDKKAVADEVVRQIKNGKTSISIDLKQYTPEAIAQKQALMATVTPVATVSGMSDALGNVGKGTTIASGIADPALNEILIANGIDCKIAEASTKFRPNEDRAVNVRNAASKINGMILVPGAMFSADAAFTPRTTANGYGMGNVISGGTYVKAIGGGICQVSSTLNLAVLRTGIIPIEHHNHSHRSSYIGSGLDATISAGTLDYKFVNTLMYPIYISAQSDGGVLTVSLYSNHNALAGVEYTPKVIGGNLANTTYVVGTFGGVEISNVKAYSSKYSQ